MKPESGRRILIDGSMARAGGGFTYLVNLVPKLAALRPSDRFLLWLRNRRLAEAIAPVANLEIELLPEAGWAGQLRFTALEASRRARSWGADLYFSTGEYSPPRPPCPAIASFRNPNVFTALHQGWPWPQRLRLLELRRLARRSARVCDRILFMSEDAARWIGDSVGLPRERRAVVPHGVDTDVWSRAATVPIELPCGRSFVLSVSNIYRYKNFLCLIDAWSRMARRNEDCPDLVIIGGDQDPDYRQQMEQARVATGPLAERIHLLGEVSYGEIRSWYAGASLFVFPSYLETFGHPLLEAMAMELPVIVADIPVFREIGDEAVRFFDPADPEALTAIMEETLASADLRGDLAKRGRDRALVYSWARAAEGLAELFDRVVDAQAEATLPRPAAPVPASRERLPIGILVLARDEESNLPDCLHSVVGWAEQVVVVLDPRTRDRSREVAERAGVEVAEHLFETYARQRNWALDQHSWRTPWILVVDADERVSPELVGELREIVNAPNAFSGYAVKKRFIFYGQWMRHCWYSSWDLRFFRHRKARYEERPVHEHMIVDGPVGYLTADLIHNDFKDMDSWISKHNHYATFEAAESVDGTRDNRLRGRLLGSPIERRRYIKNEVWNRLPFRPLFFFLYLYFWKLGLLDGRLGLRFCLMHSIFDAFVTAKAWERRFLKSSPPPNYYRGELGAFLAKHPEAAARYPAPAGD